TLLNEIVKAAAAGDVAEHAIERCALMNGHFCLGDCAGFGNVNRHPPKRVQYAHAAPVAVLANADEFVGRALEPRRPYLPVIMPNAAELVPHPRVAPQHPLLSKVAD